MPRSRTPRRTANDRGVIAAAALVDLAARERATPHPQGPAAAAIIERKLLASRSADLTALDQMLAICEALPPDAAVARRAIPVLQRLRGHVLRPEAPLQPTGRPRDLGDLDPAQRAELSAGHWLWTPMFPPTGERLVFDRRTVKVVSGIPLNHPRSLGCHGVVELDGRLYEVHGRACAFPTCVCDAELRLLGGVE
jgi:hypothetical protein